MFKLLIKSAERRHGVFIVNFEHISHLFLVFQVKVNLQIPFLRPYKGIC